MSDYERSAEALTKLIGDVGYEPDPTYSEADTRAKLLDRILREVLCWPEDGNNVRREEHIHEGYIDYKLRAGVNGLIVEAKKVGKTFIVPTGTRFGGKLSVKNLLQKQKDLREMYDQVTTYAHESSIPFCVLSNGTQWILFPGVRTDQIHIRHSRVVVFNGFKDIESNFVDFWNLLSYRAVEGGSLPRGLLEPGAHVEPTFIFNAEGRINVPYDRNPLSLVLVDILPKYFGDLHGDPTSTEMLRECFVTDSPVRQALGTYEVTGQDESPSKSLIAVSPVMHFYSLPQVGEKLDALLQAYLAGERAKYLQVMVGRVGIGKTTFLNHFFTIHKKELMSEHFVILMDYRNATEATNLNDYFNQSVWDFLSKHPKFEALMSEETLREVFADDLRILEQGPLARLRFTNTRKLDQEIASFLAQQLQNKERFLSKLAQLLYSKRLARFILVFDNVDQLDLALQEKVIQMAHAKMSDFNAFVVMSMWEETYFSSKRTGRALSTIRTVPLQIARQSTSAVIVKRLEYLIKQVRSGKEALALLNEDLCDKRTFCSFLELILRSLLVRNQQVRMFLELVALGNIRSALEMFHAFLTAGSFDTKKVIAFMHKDDEYLVPKHEFIKSVMLGSKRYYSERTSSILNLFAIGDVEHPSHFTRLRLLEWLYERRHEATPFGAGFMTLARVLSYSDCIGISKTDALTSMRRLCENALVENDLRAQKLINAAQAVSITPTGRYYLVRLCRMFAYLDLVLQDTPFLDEQAFRRIAPKCESTEMPVRFERCKHFLDYLSDQEEEELVTIEKLGKGMTWRTQFVPRMKYSYEHDKQFIIEKGYARMEREAAARCA